MEVSILCEKPALNENRDYNEEGLYGINTFIISLTISVLVSDKNYMTSNCNPDFIFI